MERAIMRDLVCRVLQFPPQMTKAVNFPAGLDCILSVTVIVRQNNYVRPILTEDSILEIHNGSCCSPGQKLCREMDNTAVSSYSSSGIRRRLHDPTMAPQLMCGCQHTAVVQTARTNRNCGCRFLTCGMSFVHLGGFTEQVCRRDGVLLSHAWIRHLNGKIMLRTGL